MFARVFALTALAAAPALAQHTMSHDAPPTAPGQSAFATISDVVAILKADPATNWSKVNIEALRQHLIDMNDVVLYATQSAREIPGGLEMTVTGAGRASQAIQRMLSMHAMALGDSPEYEAATVAVPNGARFTVTAKNRKDTNVVTRIRGLGFIGLLTEGNHHAQHHLAVARGEAHPHGQ